MTKRRRYGILEMETKYGIWELVGRLRGRNHASTMEPDLDNANVGKTYSSISADIPLRGVSAFYTLTDTKCPPARRA